MVAIEKPALVTGASGFVGSAVVRALLAAGRRVRVLMRPTSDRGNIAGLEVEVRLGSLGDFASLKAAVEGCGALFHVAADYRLWVRDPGAMFAANVDGTERLMQAALEAGIERIVYTSSVATLGLKRDGASADETTASSLDDMIGPYKQSKFQAENAVRQLVASRGLPAVIVNPSTPIGPRDLKPTPTGRLIIEAASGRMPAFVDTGLNLVHVDDVAAGHLLAEAKGRIGERYILGGENLSLAQILAEIARLVGRKAPTMQLPVAAVWPVALVAEAYGRITEREPFVTLDGLRMARKKMFFTSAKAEAELGYRWRPAARGPRRRGRLVPRSGPVPMSAILFAVAIIALAAWAYLLLGRGFFWLPSRLPPAPAPARWPSVAIIVPARNEAPHVGAAIASLLDQRYEGVFSVVLVDDHSSDGTAAIARAAALGTGKADRLTIVAARALPPGWSGKLWALAEGVRAAAEPDLLLFTDADIAHHPGNLAELAAALAHQNRDLVSLMVRLKCDSLAERFLIPAFVFFFAMLYPFAWAGDPRRRTAAPPAAASSSAARPSQRPAALPPSAAR